MTPKEWFAATNPKPLLAAVQSDNGTSWWWPVEHNPRRLRLFACAAARLMWYLLSTEARSAVLASERYAEGRATATDLVATSLRSEHAGITAAHFAYNAARSASYLASGGRAQPAPHFSPELAAYEAARAFAIHKAGPAPKRTRTPKKWHATWTTAYNSACELQAAYFRDIFPPPHYITGRSPTWITSTVRALARQMDESGDFSVVPILADALQELGCDSETILECCRLPSHVHVRGNWVVDVILGRI